VAAHGGVAKPTAATPKSDNQLGMRAPFTYHLRTKNRPTHTHHGVINKHRKNKLESWHTWVVHSDGDRPRSPPRLDQNKTNRARFGRNAGPQTRRLRRILRPPSAGRSLVSQGAHAVRRPARDGPGHCITCNKVKCKIMLGPHQE
jgi:hypothetical protein